MRPSICAVILCALLLLGGCATQTQTATPISENATDKTLADRTPIKIGLILPLTGAGAEIGQIYREGAELAVEDLNAKGETGRRLELAVEDTGSDPKTAVTVMQKMIEVDGLKLFASLTSSGCMAIKDVAKNSNVILFCDGTHPNITEGNGHVFRHSLITDDETAKFAEFIMEHGYRKVGILHANDDYGVVMARGLSAGLEGRGISLNSVEFDLKGNDFRTETAKASENSDAIFIAGFGPAFNLALKTVKDSGYKGDVLTCQGFILSKAYEMGSLVDGVYYTDIIYKDTLPEYTSRYKEKFGREPSSFSPISYGTIELLANAVKNAGSDDPVAVSKYLTSMGEFHASYENIKLNRKGDSQLPVEIKQFKWQGRKSVNPEAER